MMTAPTAQAQITLGSATMAYDKTTHSIRQHFQRLESWEKATNLVVSGLLEWEATAILRYLMGRAGLSEPDVVLAKALAARLKLIVSFSRKDLVE